MHQLASITFVSPQGALVGLVALVPLAVLALSEARARRVCRVLGLPGPGPRRWLGMAVALAAVAGLLALAAAQPVLAQKRTVFGRSDAEVYVVFDVSLSMGARAERGSPTRLARARAFALRLRDGLGDIPVGVASLSDRLLPHLFPTPSPNSFAATIERALGPGRPPTQLSWENSRGTQLEVISNLATASYFDPTAKRRFAVVLTDGESLPTGIGVLTRALRRGGVRIAFARFWARDERVFGPDGKPEAYVSDPGSQPRFEALAARLGARVFGEHDAPAAAAAVRAALGRGTDQPRGRELQSFGLTPFFAAAALLPLLYVLLHRNLPANAWRRLLRRARGRETASGRRLEGVS
jgi:hypothetical protein